MPMFESSAAITTSHAPSSAALPAKQNPELIATVGTTPLSRAIDANVGVTSGRERKLPELGSRPASPVRLPPVPARPPAALGEEHERQLPGPGELEHPVGLRVVDRTLGAGEDGVVVGADHGPGRVGSEPLGVHAADPAHHPVGRELADHLVHRQPGAGRQDEAAVLDERPGVAQVVDVLPRRALPAAATARHRVGARCVERHGVPIDDLRDVRPELVEVDLRGDVRDETADVGRLDEDERMALEHGVSHVDTDPADEPALRCGDDVLHLHRLHHHELLAGGDRIALDDGDLHDRALQRRADRGRPGRAVELRRQRRCCDSRRPWPGRTRTSEVEHGEGIDSVDLGAGESRCARAPPASAPIHSPGRVGVLGSRRRARRCARRRTWWSPRRRGRRGDAGSPAGTRRSCRRLRRAARRARAAAFASASGERGRRRVRDDLGEQRVEARAGAVPRVAERVRPVPGAGGHLERRQHAAGGPGGAVGRHRLHVHPALHRDAARCGHRGLVEPESREGPAARPAPAGRGRGRCRTPPR